MSLNGSMAISMANDKNQNKTHTGEQIKKKAQESKICLWVNLHKSSIVFVFAFVTWMKLGRSGHKCIWISFRLGPQATAYRRMTISMENPQRERKTQNGAMRYFSSSSKYGDCSEMAICAFEGKFFHFWLEVAAAQVDVELEVDP